MTGYTSKKAGLLALLEQEGELEQELVDYMSEAEREKAGEPLHWAPKDILAHKAAWQEHFAFNLARQSQGQSIELIDDMDEVNAGVFEKYRTWSFAQVQVLCLEARRRLREGLELLSEESLAAPSEMAYMRGRPLWRVAVVDIFLHPAQHLTQAYLELGDLDRMLDAAERAANLLAGLDDSPAWQGLVSYNLACNYALAGRHDSAIRLLGEAFNLNPELVEWSKQDTDLASLQELEEYQALYR